VEAQGQAIARLRARGSNVPSYFPVRASRSFQRNSLAADRYVIGPACNPAWAHWYRQTWISDLC
jgi:hypothetical protein